MLDSGASRHMTGNRSLLTEVREATGPTVTFADNSKGRTVGYGKYKVGRIIIEEISLVEGLQHNLLSVSQFCTRVIMFTLKRRYVSSNISRISVLHYVAVSYTHLTLPTIYSV